MTALEPGAVGSAAPLTRTYVLAGAIAAAVIYVAVLFFGLVLAAAVENAASTSDVALASALREGIAGGVGAPAVPLELVAALDEVNEASGVLRMAAIIAASAIGFGLAPWLMLRVRGATVAFGSLRPSLSDFGFALLGFIGAFVAVYAYVLIVRAAGLDSLEPVSTISNDDFYEHVSVVVLLGISAVIVAPVAEEVFFRGFLVGALGRAWSAPIALVASSAIFAALHFDIGSMIPFALVGLVFGALYLRTGSIVAPVLAHLGFNLVGYFGSLANQGVL